MLVAISPKHTSQDIHGYRTGADVPLDLAVGIFAESVGGYKLGVAREILDRRMQNCGFAVLDIVFSYFEMIAKYRYAMAAAGSCQRFWIGVGMVFPEVAGWDPVTQEHFYRDMYHNVRCAMYHSAMPTGLGVVHTLGEDIVYDDEHRLVLIDPDKLVRRLQEHFGSYIAELRDPANAEVRGNFRRTWDEEYALP